MTDCTVSFIDTSGIRHAVEVRADSLYEAAVLAIRAFRNNDCEPAGMNLLEVEIRSSIKHSLTVNKVHEWLNGACKSPNEKARKEELKALL